MFTGIIENLGRVEKFELTERKGQELVVHLSVPVTSGFEDVKLGESIAVNGVCLTVASIIKQNLFEFFISQETLLRSNLGKLAVGGVVNLERSLRLSDRLSGHMVQGHVDGQARILAIKNLGQAHELVIELPENLLRYVVEKGSITLDGISLTVNSINKSSVYLMIIPHTWTHTHLHTKQVGQDLNVESDVIAKYVERLLSTERPYAHNS